MHETTATLSDGPKTSTTPSFGLRAGTLSPLETLAQSVSTIAPSTSPTLTVPLVFALAGDGTCLAYALALGLIVLVALCVARFARESASPGSLYEYTRCSLPPSLATVTACALFFAYAMTAASVIGGFLNYAYVFLGRFGPHVPATLLACACAAVATWVAYRDVKISARLMLWIETVSVVLIACVIALTLVRHGLHFDRAQFDVHRMSFGKLRVGGMLAIFSFVGFESATTLGAEARDPMRTIPRAVIGSALLAGAFFLLSSYGEVVGFRGSPTTLAASTAPMRYLAAQVGVGFAGVVIDAGVLVSMFAATLACVIAASRVLLLMAHNGLAHAGLSKTHAHNQTPAAASLVAGIAALLPAVVLAGRGVSGADIYGWMGTLAVFGFLTAYIVTAAALAVHVRRQGRLSAAGLALPVSAMLAMFVALVGNLYPLPDAPYRYFPYVYLFYLLAAFALCRGGLGKVSDPE
ncbi:MAG TPA: APC family permease [Acidobacteriaceae bacterium]